MRFASFFVLWACTGQPTEPPPDELASVQTAAVDVDDPSTCAPCHAAVVEEWRQSMHSRSHHDHDPIYGAMRALRMEKQGPEIAGMCNQCHAPRAPGEPDSAAALQGVSCGTCHAVSAIDTSAGPGAKALTFDDTVLRGPHDLAASASPAHGTGPAAAHLTDGQTMCLVCHDATKTPGGAAACTTGPEHASLEGDATCTGCHMPRADGASGSASTRPDHASHVFAGPHRAWYQDDVELLRQGVEMKVARDGQAVAVTLTNTSGHAFPTGFPGHMAFVKVSDGDWEEVVLLNKVYVDAKGEKVPAAFATELKSDTRLKPGETRAIEVEVPDGVGDVQVELGFRLLPPPLAEKLGLADAPEAQPRIVHTASP